MWTLNTINKWKENQLYIQRTHISLNRRWTFNYSMKSKELTFELSILWNWRVLKMPATLIKFADYRIKSLGKNQNAIANMEVFHITVESDNLNDLIIA